MTGSAVPEAAWRSLRAFVAQHLGLDFPPSRQSELQRGLALAASEWGFTDPAQGLAWLLAQRPRADLLGVLARHLTIGETYFFRDREALEVLTREVLAPLVAARAGNQRYLRVWSAGCSTGEEAYTLAILLHRLTPDIARWNVSIVATDVNLHALRRAQEARYGEWSFRDAPAWLKPQYFSRGPDGRYTLLRPVRDMVRFGYANLAQARAEAEGLPVPRASLPGLPALPQIPIGLRAMDLILCRNVLMYFDAAHARQASDHLHACLQPEGWLLTSACEASPQLFPAFAPVDRASIVLLRRAPPPARAAVPLFTPQPVLQAAAAPTRARTPVAARAIAEIHQAPATPQADQGAVAAATPGASTPGAVAAVASVPDAAAVLGHAEVRALADRGALSEALQACEGLLAQDKLDARAHWLRGMVLLELGRADEAERSLQRALYVDPDFGLAHLAKGQIAQARQAHGLAHRHFLRAQQSLGTQHPDGLVDDADGLTHAALAQALQSLVGTGAEAAAARARLPSGGPSP